MYTLLKKNKIYPIILFAILLIASFTFYSLFFFDDNFNRKPLVSIETINYNENEYENFVKNVNQGSNFTNNLPIIAHAGGGYKNLTYTNSIDTLEFNKNNYDLFELDFFFNR